MRQHVNPIVLPDELLVFFVAVKIFVESLRVPSNTVAEDVSIWAGDVVSYNLEADNVDPVEPLEPSAPNPVLFF